MKHEDNEKNRSPRLPPSQKRLFLAVLAIGCAGSAFQFLRSNGMHNSAALYVGLPLLLALGLSLTPKAKSAVGATMKGITIALLLAAPVFKEGYICILFSAPIFYLIGYTAAVPIDAARNKKKGKNVAQAALVSTVLALMALEGSSERMSFPRHHEISVTKVVSAPVDDIRSALRSAPEFGTDKPFFLRIFPYPVSVTGEGLDVGDERRARFVAYKHIFWNKVEGDAVFRVVAADERRIRFEAQEDTSYVGYYVGWKTSEVVLKPLDESRTQVTWTLSFHRKYDPYWYFGTLQKYAVRLVAEELIDHAATPRI